MFRGSMLTLAPDQRQAVTQQGTPLPLFDASTDAAYILLAIDHGWTVNWRDPTTLRRYLMGGIAIDIAPAAELRRDVQAQSP